ncbi:MAG: MarR family transcriptional regulator [Alphaproteobacteria bacterium]|nr:MarR family transcriptional regulator [Alphaproteobacteria bacterium]
MKSSDSETLGFLIHNVARLIRKRFEQRAVDYGLSAAHWRLLFWGAKEEGQSQARLAEFLEIEPISVSRLLDRMESCGWIERRSSIEDRRVRSIHLSQRAREVFPHVRGMAEEVYDEALASMTGIQKDALIEALKIMTNNLSAGIAGNDPRHKKDDPRHKDEAGTP